MKNNYFEKAEKKYFSIPKKDEETIEEEIEEEIEKDNFDKYKNSTDKYKKTSMRIKIFKYEIKD